MNTSDEQAIRAAVRNYVDGVRQGSVDRLRVAFSDDAIMSGYLADEGMVIPIEQFYGLVADTPPPAETGEPFEAEIRRIDAVERTASVEIAERNLMGFDFTTWFHLVKLDGEWQIVSKLFETHPAAN